MKRIDLTIGSDPEVMILDLQEGRMASSLRVLNGQTKHNPIDLKDGMKMYADNVLVEVSFPPVSANGDSAPFIQRIQDALGRMQEKIGPRYQVVCQASHDFHPDELGPIFTGEVDEASGLPKKSQAWETGCNPNHDAYTETQNLPADFSTCGGLRTGSMHIHLGNQAWKTDDDDGPLLTYDSRVAAVKLFAIYVGCASVIFDRDPTGLARRKLYGKAGEYRPTSYGVECRCLGNNPLASSKTVGLVYDLTTYAVRLLEGTDYKDILQEVNDHMVQEAVNTNNVDLARHVLTMADLPTELFKRVEAVGA